MFGLLALAGGLVAARAVLAPKAAARTVGGATRISPAEVRRRMSPSAVSPSSLGQKVKPHAYGGTKAKGESLLDEAGDFAKKVAKKGIQEGASYLTGGLSDYADDWIGDGVDYLGGLF